MRPVFQTNNGRGFEFDRPWMFDFEPKLIAKVLSKVCRFAGHTNEFYSVAQHCIHVSELLPPYLKFYGLMHDAHEAFVGDMITPLKAMLPEYRKVEDLSRIAIANTFGLAPTVPSAVKDADTQMLVVEARDLLPMYDSHRVWEGLKDVPIPRQWFGVRIVPMSMREAESEWLRLFTTFCQTRGI